MLLHRQGARYARTLPLKDASASHDSGRAPARLVDAHFKLSNINFEPVSYTHLTLPTICSV
eukprot:10416210-Alexandrium_andersonii.AAC.1